MIEVLRLLVWGWALAAGVMGGLWLIQRRTGNAGIVDVGWAAITGGLAILYGVLGEGELPRRLLLALLGGIWGGRLAWHLLRDRVWGQPEEGRYVTLRNQWSPHAERAFFIFFQAQALTTVVLSLPFALAASARVAFKRDPASKGQTCRRGLWRYSRHPNYFFEWLLWCGFGLLGAVATIGAVGPWGWLALLAPLTILYSIVFVTGIPPTEAQAVVSRGEDYRHYQRTTSPFVPWLPRRDPLATKGD